MFCPNCALQNSDESGFCRSCGTNLAIVRQALTTQPPDDYDELADATACQLRKGKSARRPSLEKGVTEIFVGVAFLLVSFAVMMYAPAGRIWWFWMLIPAFSGFGKGVAQIMAYNRLNPKNAVALPPSSFRQFPEQEPANSFRMPVSVTEGTTRTLDIHRDRIERQMSSRE